LAKDDDWLTGEGDLWALATTVINKIMQDEHFINAYNEPHEKKSVLERLLADLRHSQERSRNS
jgi:hypothetical protein